MLTCRLPDLIATYIWVFQEWEPDLTRFIASRLGDGDVFFVDVGANIGYYSLLAAGPVGVGGRVVAVEASPPTMFSDLHHNVVVNEHGDRIREVNMAAAAKTGTLTVFTGPRHNAGMTTTLSSRGLHAESTVEAKPLEEILTFQEITSARLIKIDVEGAEPDVLAGMRNLIGTLRDDAEIVVELSPSGGRTGSSHRPTCSGRSSRPVSMCTPWPTVTPRGATSGPTMYATPSEYASRSPRGHHDSTSSCRVTTAIASRSTAAGVASRVVRQADSA